MQPSCPSTSLMRWGRSCRSPALVGWTLLPQRPPHPSLGSWVCPVWGPWGRPCAHWALPARAVATVAASTAAVAPQGDCRKGPLCPTLALSRATLPPCRSEAIGATRRRLDLSQGYLHGCDENLEELSQHAQLLGQGSCTTSPNYAPNTVWQPGENSRTLYILVQICLPAVWLQGEACVFEPGEMGVCSRPRGRGPRPEWELPPHPADADCAPQTAASSGALDRVQDTEEEALVTF